jgi:hypothetical protein
MSDGPTSDDVFSRVASVLLDKKFVNRICKALISARDASAKLESAEFDNWPYATRLNRDLKTLTALESFVSEHLTENLGFPCPVTAHEVIESLYQQLGARNISAESYSRAVEYALHPIGNGYAELCNTDNWIDFGKWQPDGEYTAKALEPTSEELVELGISEFTFAESVKFPNPYMLDWVNFGDHGYNLAFSEDRNWQERTYIVRASIWAHATRNAIKDVEAVIFPHLIDILQIVQCGGDTWSYLDSSESRITIRECFESLCAERAKLPSSIRRRLAIAIRFLTSARQQDSRAVAYLLTFGAIEALICEKSRDPGVEEQLAGWIPTLLQPSGSSRDTYARSIRNLYDLRSRIAHGSNLEASEANLIMARRLAAGTVIAVCHWLDHCRRHTAVGDMFALDESDDRRLKSHIQYCYREHQTIADVPDLSRMLPRS